MGENLLLGFALTLPVILGGLLVLFHRRRSQRKPQRYDLVAGNVLLLFFLLGILLASGEVYFRFIYDSTDSLLYTKVSQRWMSRYWHENRSELRDDIEYLPAIEQGKRRITFVGDSFTAGHGVKDVENRFVNQIRRLHPEWEVQMLARPGYDTGDELSAMKDCLAGGYKLDIVVLVYCLNDVADMMPEWTDAMKRVGARQRQEGWLSRNSFLLNMIFHRIAVRQDPHVRGYFDFVKRAYSGAIWEQQAQRLMSFRNLIESNGGHLCVVTFPFLQTRWPEYEYQFAHDELALLWSGLKIPQLDLLPVYRGIPADKLTVNRFDPHPNERAHALAAEAISSFLTNQSFSASTSTQENQLRMTPMTGTGGTN